VTVVVREFRPGDEAAFRDINLAWIERFFAIEPKDREVLADPRKYILDPGGAILIADDAGETIGVVALIVMGNGSVELAKMCVVESAQGKGVGRLLIAEATEKARAMGMSRVYLETNSVLAPALKLYRDAGFVPLAAPLPSPYARADVQFELWL